MQAHSGKTGITYESWDALVQAEADGYAVVILFEQTSKSGRTQMFARVLGRYKTRERAQNVAAYRRRWWVEHRRDLDHRDTRLVGVHVEPIWKEM